MNLVLFYRKILYPTRSFVSKVRVIHEFGAISQKDTISYALRSLSFLKSRVIHEFGAILQKDTIPYTVFRF